MKKLTMFLSLLCLTAALAVPAGALEYDIDAPNGPEYAKATSVEPVVTADRGERSNENLSKDTSLMPPNFGGGVTFSPGEHINQAVFPMDCTPVYPTTVCTAVTEDLYYGDGSLGRLTIPSLGVNVKVVQGTDSAALAKGAGHFEDSSVWGDNVCLAGVRPDRAWLEVEKWYYPVG